MRDADKLFHSDAVPIDHLIAPEQLVIDNIYRLIEYPGALQVVNFAEVKSARLWLKPIMAAR